jgi:purine-binding chemotaxis protein CheW
MANELQICTFRIDRLSFGIEVRSVKGVTTHPRLTRVPLAPPAVHGLTSFRGQVIAGLDLRPCLGLETARAEHQWSGVILKVTMGPVSLLVDEIGDVVTIQEDCLEPPPETLPAELREITESVYEQNGKLLLLLNVEQVIHVTSAMMAT